MSYEINDRLTLKFNLKDKVHANLSLDNLVNNKDIHQAIFHHAAGSLNKSIIPKSEDIVVRASKVGVTLTGMEAQAMQADLGEIIKRIIDLLTSKLQDNGFSDAAIQLKISKITQNGILKSLKGEVRPGSAFNIDDFLNEM